MAGSSDSEGLQSCDSGQDLGPVPHSSRSTGLSTRSGHSLPRLLRRAFHQNEIPPTTIVVKSKAVTSPQDFDAMALPITMARIPEAAPNAP